jgi:NAD(P)-dependent dehydrogenase (short-subunit alcohol dehydrogenase family)
MELSSISAVITGGASGLGRATAARLAAAGARVALLDRPASAGFDVAKSLGPAAVFTPADVTSADEVAGALERAVAAGGGLNVLVNCAGIGTAMKTFGKAGPARLEDFTRVIQVNLIGTFNCIRLAAVHMARNTPNPDGERGVVINTASVAAFDGQIGQAAYSASKGGVLAMALPIARDLMNEGVRVNTILPGVFKTPMVAMMPSNVQDALGAQVPFPKRLGQADEYARLACFMIENPYMNAAAVRLDGGIRMAPR